MPPTRNRDAEEEVFRAAPSDFVRTRNAAAARLRKAGRTEQAAEIAQLRKPSPALWATNQLAHEHSDELGAFLTAVDKLRKAQFGPGGAGAREAATRQRHALDDLITLATGILSRAHLATTPSVLRRVSNTLVGAAADKGTRERLQRGRLTEEHAAPGFEAFAGEMPSARPKPPLPVKLDVQQPEAATRRQVRHQERAAARDARAIEREHRAAVQGAAILEREAAHLRQRAEQAEQGVERLRQQLREAEERAGRERRRAEDAERSARRARERIGQHAPQHQSP